MLQSERINFKRIWKGLSPTPNSMVATANPQKGLSVAGWKYVMSLIILAFLFSFLSSPGAYAEASITFSLDAQVGAGTIDSQPTDPTAIIYRSGNLKVENAKNYQIKTTSSSNVLSNGSAELTALAEGKTLTEMAAGKWGLTILDEAAGSTAVPTASSTYNSPSQTLDSVSISETTNRKLTFGVAAKVNSNQASGTYEGATLTISILAEDAAASLPSFYTISNMDEMNTEVCTSVGIPNNTTTTYATVAAGNAALAKAPASGTIDVIPTTTLTDTRGSKNYSYLVSRLADGNCWMVQNLALEGGVTLHSSDSDVSSDYPLPSSSTSGFSDNNAKNMYNGSHTNGTNDSTSNTGAYYNYVVATAGTYKTSQGQVASSSVCPKGWKLPTGGTTGSNKTDINASNQFDNLAKTYLKSSSISWSTGTSGYFQNVTSSSTDAYVRGWMAAWRPAFVGFYLNSSLSSSGSYSYWWSSTAYSSTNGHRMYQVSSGDLYPGNSNGRLFGFSVRCVYTPPTMQDFTSTECNTLTIGEPIALVDKRDGKGYLISRLKDNPTSSPNGRCWMVQNLALGSNSAMTLTSELSNVTATRTLPASTNSFRTDYNTAQIHVGTHQDAKPDHNVDNQGTYYSYSAATLNTHNNLGTSYTEATGKDDVCPKGWHLPKYTELYSGSTSALGSYSSDSATFSQHWQTPNYSGTTTSLVGRYVGSSINTSGSLSLWWAGRAKNNYADYLLLSSNGFSNDYNYRYLGSSVRCVFTS